MPAKDIYHEVVKQALVEAGWIITHDPLRLAVGTRNIYIDLGAETLIAAEQSNIQIAVEIKSFRGQSPIKDLHEAIGQFVVYKNILVRTMPQRKLYLAVSTMTYIGILSEEIGQIMLADPTFRWLVFDEQQGSIQQWLPSPITPSV
jgi:hypothetical protein